MCFHIYLLNLLKQVEIFVEVSQTDVQVEAAEAWNEGEGVLRKYSEGVRRSIVHEASLVPSTGPWRHSLCVVSFGLPSSSDVSTRRRVSNYASTILLTHFTFPRLCRKRNTTAGCYDAVLADTVTTVTATAPSSYNGFGPVQTTVGQSKLVRMIVAHKGYTAICT